MSLYDDFLTARDQLLADRTDYDGALARFAWPETTGREFNWALEHVDAAAGDPERGARLALWIVEEDGSEAKFTFAELSARSNRVAGWLQSSGVRRGDRVILMLANQVELWETILATMKLGAVLIPTTPMMGPADLRDRVERGNVRHVVVRSEDTTKFDEVPGAYGRIAVGDPVEGWLAYPDAGSDGDAFTAAFSPEGTTRAEDTLLLYFTSGTTASPKLVEHTHASYPVGHLSTMYWIGLQPGDVHLNVASPGWAKHAWSNVFAPWIAEACVLIVNVARFSAERLVAEITRCGATTFCAPPTVWRMLIQSDLGERPSSLREVVGAGEPLNPEVIAQVRARWGLTIRDGFGQTETSVQIANTPGQPLKEGSMGRPVPGFEVALLDPVSGEPAQEGEISLVLDPRPVGLMTGYHGDPEKTEVVMRDGYYRTGDVGSRDEQGYITYIGRADDVFKASDYRISPFELESVLITHPAVAEAAVVPSPDALRLAVPKAYVVLAAGHEPDRATALAILAHARENLAPYKRIRRLEFMELPKTVSGKIRRVELRGREAELHADPAAEPATEYRDVDFPELRL
ncbi:MAG: AMP-binding protein [Mycobacteriaceae bacterium]